MTSDGHLTLKNTRMYNVNDLFTKMKTDFDWANVVFLPLFRNSYLSFTFLLLVYFVNSPKKRL